MIVGFNSYKNKYQFKVTGIIHVGAHVGQEYEEYMETFGSVETHWFEPVENVFSKLSENLSGKPDVSLYNFGLGEDSFTTKMFVDSGNDAQSSSILKPKLHTEEFPHIEFPESSQIEIKVEKLDNFFIESCNMLVLDTQGYELNVLKGSILTLKNIDYIFTEFNTIEMYENCPTLEDLDNFLREFGFERLETWYTNQNWGDAMYIKNKNHTQNTPLNNCKLSVTIPCYKHKDYLRECLESVIKQQTNFNFEILIRDDYSCDGSEELISEIIKENQNTKISFKHFKSYKNWGGSKNIKYLFLNCGGEYIAYLDGDDFFCDELKLQKQIDFLDSNPNYSLHSTSSLYLDKNGDFVNKDFWKLNPIKESVSLEDMLDQNIISFGRVFRNSPNLFVDDFGEFNYHDWVLNYKIIKNGLAHCADWVGGAYRNTGEGQMTKLKTDEVFELNRKIKNVILNVHYKSVKSFTQNNEQEIILDFFSNQDFSKLRFLDIGANDGISFSNTHALSLLGWSGFCFEPSKLAFEKLTNLYSQNSKIKCFNVGISDTSGKKTFYESRDWVDAEAPVSVLSSLHIENKDRFYGMNWEETVCEFLTYDDFLNRYEIREDTFDFISIDCEGHDFVVLSQIQKILNKTKLICVEYTSESDLFKFSDMLSKYNFEFYHKTKDNVLFRKSEKSIVIIDCFISDKNVESDLINQIEKIKKQNLDILLISNTIMSIDIQQKVDYFIYDKRNQLFQYEYTNLEEITLKDYVYIDKDWQFTTNLVTNGLQRHGLSVLVNLFNAVKFAKSIGYKNFWRVEVDDLFCDESLKFIKSCPDLINSEDKKAILYYNSNNISFHFMFWNIDYFLEKIPQIRNEEDYKNLILKNFDSLDFIIVEEFIWKFLKINGDSDVLVKDGQNMSLQFPNTVWNTNMSLSNMSPKYENCPSLIFKMNNKSGLFIFTKNYSNDFKSRRIVVYYSDYTETIVHETPEFNTWCWNIVSENVYKYEVYEKDRLLYVEDCNQIKNYVEFP